MPVLPTPPNLHLAILPPLHAQTNLNAQIHCYSLPYGLLGFLSHSLTYYTLICLYTSRSPLYPRRKLRFTKLDLCLACVGLAVSVPVVCYTFVRCRAVWQLVVLAVWKLGLSLVNGITAVHVAVMLMNAPASDQSGYQRAKVGRTARRWIVIYIPGMMAGMSGLASLVIQHWHHAGIIPLTIAFFSLIGLGLILGLVTACMSSQKILSGDSSSGDGMVDVGLSGLGVAVSCFTILAAFYSDWAIGAMTGNWIGLPTSDNSVLYWTYFVAKRLAMLSS